MVAKRLIHVAVVLVVLAGCSKESLLRSSLEDPTDRKETIELTLKIFDEHPEYVDELFELAKGHDPTFDRLVQQAATALNEAEFATKVASKLANHPKAVELITRAMMVQARTNPELRQALAAAILSEGDVMNQIVAEHPQLIKQVLMRSIRGPAPPSPPAPPPVE